MINETYLKQKSTLKIKKKTTKKEMLIGEQNKKKFIKTVGTFKIYKYHKHINFVSLLFILIKFHLFDVERDRISIEKY